MNYEEYEDIFITRAKMPAVDVSALPHVDVLNDARPTSKARVFIMFNGSTYGDPENMEVTAQRETLNFEAFIKAKNRRGKNGVLALAEEIKGRFLGFKPQGAITPVTLSNFGYVAGIQNCWQYMLTFTFDRYKVQRSPEETPAPLIKKIKTNIEPIQ